MFNKLYEYLKSQEKEQTVLSDDLWIDKIRLLEIILRDYLQYFNAIMYPASSKWSESISTYKDEIQLEDVRIPLIDFDKPLEKQVNEHWIDIFQDENKQINVFKELLSEGLLFTPHIYNPILYLKILLIYYTYVMPKMPNKLDLRIDFITTKVVAYALLTIIGFQIKAGHMFRIETTSIAKKAKKNVWAEAIIAEYNGLKESKTKLSKRGIADLIRRRMETKMEKAPSIDTIIRRLKENNLI